MSKHSPVHIVVLRADDGQERDARDVFDNLISLAHTGVREATISFAGVTGTLGSDSRALAGLALEVKEITTLLKELGMTLNAQGEELAKTIDDRTNKIAEGLAAVKKSFEDWTAKFAEGSIDAAEFKARTQPSLDLLGDLGEALVKTATDNDPAITPGAPPIVIPPVPPVGG